ncbi:tetratricopeptide repeat protein [Sphingobium subterraneum]|uniref:Cytochrome c-type biogenesis protein CcmH n=1 Tax=Sphingobium subterraneum TaxID=627688 RepID=A0A841J5F7_9SPHN|nr:tetratricopeptide repeat protein [Sphingobium subterraneum]MBB6124766.1 cytochrome c-type biogenesis protein CcmH [Sphingobium subterraneum]
MSETGSTRPWGRILLGGAVAVALVSVGYAVSRDRSDAPPPVSTASPAPSAAADPEAVIRQLQERVGANPKDAEGWQQLGWVYFETARYAEAARAYRRATDLVPGNATFWSSLGEALVMADERDPMPADAAKAFDRALAIDAKDPRARYFLGVRKDLGGDHTGALDVWFALLADTPPGAPWEKDLRRTIEQVGKINSIDVASRLAAITQTAPHLDLPNPVATAAIPGPTTGQMQAAASLPKGQQDQMIQGMVDSLEAKLKGNPGNVDGWIMLMRSRMTLGETGKAAGALKSAIAANPAQEKRLRSEAALLSVPGA